MTTFRVLRLGLLLAVLGLFTSLHAEDIDLYTGNQDNTDLPNVLFVIDTGANFSSSAPTPCTTYADGSGAAPSLGNTGGGVEQCALVNLITGLGSKLRVNFGILVNNNNNFATDTRLSTDPAYHEVCQGSAGGCVIRKLTDMTVEANRTNLVNFIKSWRMSGNNSATEFNVKSGGDATASNMQEAWAYYNGKIGMSGKNYAENRLNGCQKNFIIFIGNSLTNSGTPRDSASPTPDNTTTGLKSLQVGATDAQKIKISETVIFDPSARADKKTCGVTQLPATTAASDWSENWADEWARLMNQKDGSSTLDGAQNIITYTVGIIDNSGTNTCKPDYPALLKTAAKYGGGSYFQTEDTAALVAAFEKILNEVQAVNSVFASSSLPVSVNAQGTYLNQVFLGMFRPDAKAGPRWVGNLKQYQFILSGTDLILGDNDTPPKAALNSIGGFISPNAISFWTSKTSSAPDSTGGFFVRNPQGVGAGFDSPDGEVVEKGGVAQQLRLENLTAAYSTSPGSPRRLYTYCPGGASCDQNLSTASANVFATGNTAITSGLLGVADTGTRDTLIKWVRGQDNCTGTDCGELGPGSPYTVRPSVHGDALHSRPVVVNYGGTPNKLVVFYGANDGVFRAVNGSQADAIVSGAVSVPPGGELWGLVLPEHYARLNRQRINTPELKMPGSTESAARPKDYFVDGATGAYQQYNADGTIKKAWLFLSMRRGGRFIYALDVTDPTAPKVMWRKSSVDTGFGEMGQTWSRPRIALVKGHTGPVLVFGAGYAGGYAADGKTPIEEDAEPPGTDTMGRGIFMLDAETGALVWRATPTATSTADAALCGSTGVACAVVSGMNWSIPAEIGFVDRGSDGYTERLYAVDTGGNVWRVDLEPLAGTAPANWQVTQLAALGCGTGACATGTTPRKFFYPPSVIPVGSTGSVGAYDAVLLGSGDREHPLKSNTPTYAVVNRLYLLKDTDTGKSTSRTTPITESGNLFNATSVAYDGSLSGYYVTLTGAGEKVVNAPLTVKGTTFFGTNAPTEKSATSCSNLGLARGYALDPFTAKYGSTNYEGGGLPPSAVSGIVAVKNADGKTVLKDFCMGCGGADNLQAGGGTTSGTTADQKSAFGAKDPGKPVPKKVRRTYWYKK
jgi:type IV pilus assembly protein PilY1